MMSTETSDDTELAIRERWDAGDWADAATLWIEARGPEVLTFLAALRAPDIDGSEVFSQFCEDLWRGLPAFRWECTTRTWSYRLARNAWTRALKRVRRRGPHVPLSDLSRVRDLAAAVRSSTAIHLRTEVKDRFAALRDELPPDDQMLLILRVDRDLGWTDIARVMLGDADEDGPGTITRESARLRKQFQRVKGRLRELADAHGLLSDA